MSNQTADKIIAKCRALQPSLKTDCVEFASAVLQLFFTTPDFDGTILADAVLGKLRAAASPWRRTMSIPEAIAAATSGQFVLAGLTSQELGKAHGHLAIVAGVAGALSGNVVVPIGYAGSIGSGAIFHERLSGSFKATLVRESKVEYFIRKPDIEPAASALNIILETAVGRTRVCFFWPSQLGVTTPHTHCLQGGTTKLGSPKNVQSCS
jgi:hypothetical protein